MMVEEKLGDFSSYTEKIELSQLRYEAYVEGSR